MPLLLTTTMSKNGLTTTTTTSGGGLTRQSSVTQNAQGRTVQQVDEEGRITNFLYQDGGRTVSEQDGAGTELRVTQQFFDGQTLSVTGAAVVAEYHDYAVSGDGLLTETVHYGSADGAMYRQGKRGQAATA